MEVMPGDSIDTLSSRGERSRDDRSGHVTAVRRRVSANTCCNALDLHVERGRADQPALIYGPLANVVRSDTYRELRDETARFAGALVEGRDYLYPSPSFILALVQRWRTRDRDRIRVMVQGSEPVAVVTEVADDIRNFGQES
jgi:hypothetical protein